MSLQSIVLKAKKKAKGLWYSYKNRELLSRYNLNLKKFSARHFPEFTASLWLDLPDAAIRIEEKRKQGLLSDFEAEQLRNLSEKGYIVLRRAVDHKTVDLCNGALTAAVRAGKIAGVVDAPESLKTSRALDLHEKIPELRLLFEHPTTLHWMNLIFERRVVPFQSLNFFYGSQQRAHSDAIHMTTYPLGYMAASWTALEDISPDSGPLCYYPGTHRLPYVFSHDCGIENEEYVTEGRDSYSEKYETFVERKVQSGQYPVEYLIAEKGDVLIWHHNLIHGGSPKKNPEKSRKSFVCHYFAEGVICYHDLINEQANIREDAR